MSNRIQSLVAHIKVLQDELEQELSERAETFRYSLNNHRVTFQADVAGWQKQFKAGLWGYIVNAPIRHVVTIPFIYGLIVPFVILDIGISLYQAICFPAYKIKKVVRSEYMVFDRQHLAYLNSLEKLNCLYCSYGNGLLAYALEVAARTEAFWCPIKHAGKQAAYHRWYGDFAEYGDAENYTTDLGRNRGALNEVNAEKPPASD